MKGKDKQDKGLVRGRISDSRDKLTKDNGFYMVVQENLKTHSDFSHHEITGKSMVSLYDESINSDSFDRLLI